ncbi:MAG: Rpn family recombination-promoting nuclease/putative transposase, partial [Bernardetiaceae bacterium]|nr:Rpn family recombination-promoting nuclease/putative transposase [Bernardetiaceae bacterium]
PLFHKKEHELADRFDKWCFFLKNLESFDHIPAILNEPIFKKAFGTAALTNLTAEQRDRYEMSLIQYWDMKSAIETAVEEAVEAAVEDAIEGRNIEIAKNAILQGLANEMIAMITGLSIEQVEKIRQGLGK